MTNWWPFPPRTQAAQFDERWSFVGKKEARCNPEDPADLCRGDAWDHTAVDPAHRLVLSLVPGKRTAENCKLLVADVQRRTGGRTDLLLTSDEQPPYKEALAQTYAVAVPQPKRTGPGRPPRPKRELPQDLVYATVHKVRENGHVVKVLRAVVFGTTAVLAGLLARLPAAQRTINTAFVERNNGTERGQNARKTRRSYRFSKDWETHHAVSYFTAYSYNFCWAVRTLREKDVAGHWRERTPAMAAGLASHVWSLQEWALYPAKTG